MCSSDLDELLSGKELLVAAENDNRQKLYRVHDIVFGMLDCAIAMFLFFPFFGQKIENVIHEVSLLNLTELMWYIRVPYMAVVAATILCGIATLTLQNCTVPLWIRNKRIISLFLSACGCLIFMISLQPYAAMFTFFFLLIKGVLLLKRP